MQINHSTTIGTTGWFQGNSTVFPAQGGTATSYIGANFNNTTNADTISNWLLTPPVTLQNNVTMTFYTRTVDVPTFPDRLQVRMSTNGSSSNVGTTATDVGDFTTLMLDINPTYTTTGYPNVWTQFTVTVTGVTVGDQWTAGVPLLCGEWRAEWSELRLHRDRYVRVQWTVRWADANRDSDIDWNTVGYTNGHSHRDSYSDSPESDTNGHIHGDANRDRDRDWNARYNCRPQPHRQRLARRRAQAQRRRRNRLTSRRVCAFRPDANVGIGGFIITGTAPKQVLLRGIGPSLANFGVPDPLADPVMELHGPTGFVTITNDNWKDTQQAAIKATGIPPTNDLESAILATLPPGNYTAILRGKDNTTGVALVEIYDLDQAAASKLANISTRAFVGTDSNVVIAGFILGNGAADDNVIVRGIGPSLTAFGVPDALANPTLELRNSNGALLVSNNDWQDDPTQAAIITAAGLAPTNPLESGIAATLAPGQYTAILAGLNNATGVGLVEVYDLRSRSSDSNANTGRVTIGDTRRDSNANGDSDGNVHTRRSIGNPNCNCDRSCDVRVQRDRVWRTSME